MILKMRGIMDFLLVFLISPKLVGTTYKTEQREYLSYFTWMPLPVLVKFDVGPKAIYYLLSQIF